MATIKQVAERAGVSVATVSRVVNKTGYVSDDLAVRVQSAMDTLNYHPSALARGLRRQQSQTVGILVPQLDQPFFSALAFTIEKALFASDYRVLVCSSEESGEKESAYVDMLIRQRVDGCILVPTGHSAEPIRRLLEQNVPGVLVDRDLPTLTINRVLCDNLQGAYEGARHLLDLGHRLIALIGGPTYSDSLNRRMEGAQRALHDAGVTLPPELITTVSSLQFDMGYQAGLRLLNQAPRPTAIFAMTDVMAVGAMHAAAELGLRIPDDLSIVGFDDVPLASHIIPQLTTVSQPIYRMGEVASSILMRRLQDPGAPVETTTLSTRLVVRASSTPPRA